MRSTPAPKEVPGCSRRYQWSKYEKYYGGGSAATRGAGVDRKTARRYVEAAESLGVKRDGGEGQLTEKLLAAVVDEVRPGRPAGHGKAWDLLEAHHEKVKELVVVKGLTVVKAGDLLARQGIVVPERTLHRYCAEHFSAGG